MPRQKTAKKTRKHIAGKTVKPAVIARPVNRVIHFEIQAMNTEKLAGWYRDLFGWEVRKWENPNMDYWIVMTGPDINKGKLAGEPGINGGITKRQGPAPQGGEPVSSFVCTIHMPSVDEYLKKIQAAGGTIALGKMAIPGLAWLAYAKDIEGNLFGIYEDDKKAK